MKAEKTLTEKVKARPATARRTNGQIAYETYCDSRGWLSFDNKSLPRWVNVEPEIKMAWEASAESVLSAALAMVPSVTERTLQSLAMDVGGLTAVADRALQPCVQLPNGNRVVLRNVVSYNKHPESQLRLCTVDAGVITVPVKDVSKALAALDALFEVTVLPGGAA